MIKTKIRKIGSSLGAILPTEAIALLQVGEGDEVFLTKDDQGIRITPYDPDFEAALNSYKKGKKQYRNALRELAK